MPYQLEETPIQVIDETWTPSWSLVPSGHRVFILADHATDASQFVGYGTDGSGSWRVQGSKERYLQFFQDAMTASGATELPPTYTMEHVILLPPTLPSSGSVQAQFDAELGFAQQAA